MQRAGRLGEQLLRGCVAPMKTGWLVMNGSGFVISSKGKDAFQAYSDPDDFLALMPAGRKALADIKNSVLLLLETGLRDFQD